MKITIDKKIIEESMSTALIHIGEDLVKGAEHSHINNLHELPALYRSEEAAKVLSKTLPSPYVKGLEFLDNGISKEATPHDILKITDKKGKNLISFLLKNGTLKKSIAIANAK